MSSPPGDHAENSHGERRLARRFPLDLDVKYRLLGSGTVVATGEGRVVNLSTRGILFQSDQVLFRGADIELSIAWPARLNGVVGLKLSVVGRTVRVRGNLTAVEIEHHEFRTSSVPEAPVA